MKYPELTVELNSKYLYINSTDKCEFKVYLQRTKDSAKTEIAYNDSKLSFASLDNNILFITENSKNYYYGINIGSATLAFYYTEIIEDITYTYSTKQEVVIYDNFFKDNYLKLLTDFDKKNIEENYLLYAVMNTCMEYFDILWAYQNDIKTISDPLYTRWKFLENLGLSLGLGKISRDNDNTLKQKISDRLYRELLSNLFDLLQIRGTKLSYDLFFGALGYDIELLEFWNDGDGNLIEINPYDEDLSTFHTYSTFGYLLNDELYAAEDPRRYLNMNNPINTYNKSFYVKPILTRKVGFEGLVEEAGYTMQHRLLINKFLTFLKPEHIEYLEEAFRIFIPLQPDPGGVNEAAETIQLLIDDSDLYIVTLKYAIEDPLVSIYLNPYTYIEEDTIPDYSLDQEDDNTHMPKVSDPGRIDWTGEIERGVHNLAGGMYIEHIYKDTSDTLDVHDLKELSDILLLGVPRYDYGYYYDASGDQTTIFYDKSVLLNEVFQVVAI